MEPRPLQSITRWCAGELSQGDPQTRITGVCTDSRRAQPGDIFFALSGEQFDGHDFVPHVVSKAAAVVVRRDRAPAAWGNCAVIAVEDPRRALGRFAAGY